MKSYTGYIDGQITKAVESNYLIHLPEEHESKPLIVYMPGAGERGWNPEILFKGSMHYDIPREYRDQFVVLVPQCRLENHYDPDDLKYLIDHICAKNSLDTNRIILTGISLGARACWDFATAYPDVPAALVPMSGYSCYLKAARIAHIPTAVFHGRQDRVVPFVESFKMVEAMKEYGAKNVQLIDYDGGHAGWTQFYSDPQLYKWILKNGQKAKQETVKAG